jgi:hypothetical protein
MTIENLNQIDCYKQFQIVLRFDLIEERCQRETIKLFSSIVIDCNSIVVVLFRQSNTSITQLSRQIESSGSNQRHKERENSKFKQIFLIPPKNEIELIRKCFEKNARDCWWRIFLSYSYQKCPMKTDNDPIAPIVEPYKLHFSLSTQNNF